MALEKVDKESVVGAEDQALAANGHCPFRDQAVGTLTKAQISAARFDVKGNRLNRKCQNTCRLRQAVWR